MDVLRAALGEAQLSYLGFSYGTTLGVDLRRAVPRQGRPVRARRRHRPDPRLPRERARARPAGFETALRRLRRELRRRRRLLPRRHRRRRRSTPITDLLDDIEAEPLPTDQDRDLEIGNAFYGIVTPLYSRDNWPILDQALQEALDGERQHAAAALRLLRLPRRPTAATPTTASRRSTRSTASTTRRRSSRGGARRDPRLRGGLARPSARCSPGAWSAATASRSRPREPTPTIDAEGAAPIVVVGTTRDPATPYEEAVALADQLESGVLLTRDGDGHTGYNKGNACIDEAVEGYLLEGTVPDDGTEC